MTTDKIAAVIEACRRAEEARLDAIEAADAAGLSVNFGDRDQIVEIEIAVADALRVSKSGNALDGGKNISSSCTTAHFQKVIA